MTRPLRLHIEQLVLHGFDPLDRYAIADAVRQELAEALGESGVPAAASVAIPRLPSGTVEAAPLPGKGIGTEIVHAVRGALKP